MHADDDDDDDGDDEFQIIRYTHNCFVCFWETWTRWVSMCGYVCCKPN